MTSIRQVVARRIAEALEKRGMSQGQLARAIDTSAGEVSAYVNARAFPRPDRIDAMAKALDLHPEELFGVATDQGRKADLSPLAMQAARLVANGEKHQPALTRKTVKILRLLLGQG